MKTIIRIIKWLIPAIIVLLVVIIAGVYFFGGQILRIGIETAGTKALGVAVDVGGVDISIFKGKVGLKKVVIKNPTGYANENLLELGDGRVTANIRSMLSDTVQINEIKLDGMSLVIEQKGLSNNLNEIVKSISAKEKGTEKEASVPSGKKLHIDNLEITNTKVKVKLLPIPGKADTVTLNLAPIKMSNLGTDNKLNTGALVSKILLAIASGVAEQGAGVLPESVTKTMKSTLETTMGLGKAVTEEGGKILGAGKGVVDGFKGLLQPKKKE